jgi:S-adenosylmethionine decarboxylase
MTLLMNPTPSTHVSFENPNGFGPHLMLDGRRCNPEKLGDVAHIFNVLNELPDKIGMTKITQPYVFPYSGLVPEDKGVTGMVVIAESHLSFHSFTEKDYFFFDLFSCKPFDVEAAMRYVVEAFDAQDVELHYVERGRHFQRSQIPASSSQPLQNSAQPLQNVVPLHEAEPAPMMATV